MKLTNVTSRYLPEYNTYLLNVLITSYDDTAYGSVAIMFNPELDTAEQAAAKLEEVAALIRKEDARVNRR